MKYCKYCGAELNEEQEVCLSCGKLVREKRVGANFDKKSKSKVAAGLLGIFFGAFGVHNFYLGYNGKALAQLLLTILTCGILGFVSSIWGFIEGILILTDSINEDATGNPLV